MSDAVVAGFTFPTHSTHTHTHMPAYVYMDPAANLPVSARLKCAGGRQGGAGGGSGGCEGLGEVRETGDQWVQKWNTNRKEGIK